MKRILLLLLAVLLVIGMAACKSRVRRNEDPLPESEEDSVSEQEPQPEPEPEPESGSESEEESKEADVAGVEQALTALVEAMQSGERDRIKEHIDYTNLMQLEAGQSDANFLAILRRLQYTLVETDAQESTATVKVQFTNVDMHTVLADYLKQAMDMEYNNALSSSPLGPEDMEREYQRLFEEMLERNSGSTLHRTVDVQLLNTGGKWRVQSSEALRAAVFGDYFNASGQVGNNAGGGQR